MEDLAGGMAAHGPCWQGLLDSGMPEQFETLFAGLDADEGTIWLLDSGNEFLVPVFNNSPNPENLVGSYRQPVDHGVISMVLAIQSAVCERDIYKNPQHDNSADKRMGVVTVHMMAAPLYFAGETRGVVSAVRLRPAGADPEGDPPPFEERQLERMKNSARGFGQWLDERLAGFSKESPGP